MELLESHFNNMYVLNKITNVTKLIHNYQVLYQFNKFNIFHLYYLKKYFYYI